VKWEKLEKIVSLFGKKDQRKDWIKYFKLPGMARSFVTSQYYDQLNKGKYKTDFDNFILSLRPEDMFAVPFKVYHHRLLPIDKNYTFG
jgi:hypothetical protein